MDDIDGLLLGSRYTRANAEVSVESNACPQSGRLEDREAPPAADMRQHHRSAMNVIRALPVLDIPLDRQREYVQEDLYGKSVYRRHRSQNVIGRPAGMNGQDGRPKAEIWASEE